MAKLHDKIAQAKKRRARREREGKVGTTTQVKLKATTGERNRVTHQHPRMLLEIEQTLVAVGTVVDADDADVDTAIRAILERKPAASDAAQELVKSLNAKQLENSYDEETWHAGLRVIYRSVTTRSKCRRGDTDYLDYATGFVARASKRR
ncbi:hypothetical protein [Roseimaritima sediminicola]|uniref:hypothetical protein n=1 Tax=Roseimaritima sediminicola TaxID=2662066 RepID=UPI0012982A97|nr:hypothetical protein [Roseimaritima sediminicola]